MSVTQEHLLRLLDKTLAQIEAPLDCAVGLEGSIAEGLGNSTSDVDFIILEDTDREFPVIPALLFIDGHRVEVRRRSLLQTRQQLATVFQEARKGRATLAGIDEGLLDRCQRFSHALPLRNKQRFEAARRILPQRSLDRVISAWFSEQAQTSVRCAMALLALGCGPEAGAWAKSALTEGVKSWLAMRGDSYLPKKWISQQLARSADEQIARRVCVLSSPGRPGLDDSTYVREVLAFLSELGIPRCDFDASNVTLKRRRNVTTWMLGERVHIIKDQREVYALNARAAQIWRSLRFGKALPSITNELARWTEDAGRCIAEFHLMGFLDIEYEGVLLSRRGTSCIPPSFDCPLLSLEGLVFSTSHEQIKYSAISAQRFVAAGMALVYANLVVENAREDALGALKAGQWGVFERSVQRILRYLSIAILSANGVNPLPSGEEAPMRICQLPGLPPVLVSGLLLLHRDIDGQDEHRACALLADVDQLIQLVREFTHASSFPLCFASSEDWQKTLDIGYDWIRIGAFLDARFPIEEVRDMIATGGQQPHVKRPEGTVQPLDSYRSRADRPGAL